MIVAVGGDGTMNEVLDGLVFCGPLTLGYIPAGSGNDLARSLKLPGNPVKALKRLLTPRHYRMLDYGILTYGTQEVSHRRFLVSAGIGFDAAVCHDLLESKLRQRLRRVGLGRLSYLISGIRQLFKCKPCKGYIILDGVKKVEFNHIAFISCHIQPFEGGGFKLAPRANCSDGKLSVCVVSHAARRKLVPILLESLTGNHGRRKGVRTYECGELFIHTERGLPVHADGESCGSSRICSWGALQERFGLWDSVWRCAPQRRDKFTARGPAPGQGDVPVGRPLSDCMQWSACAYGMQWDVCAAGGPDTIHTADQNRLRPVRTNTAEHD